MRYVKLGIVGAVIGGFIGLIIHTFEPTSTITPLECTLGFAIIGAIVINLTALMVGSN